MDLNNNKILIKYISGLLGSGEFMRIVGSKGECANDFLVSVINYSIATREVPNAKFYEKLNSASTQEAYAEITANAIYETLAQKIVANGFNPKPVSVYRDFANNFYRNGLLFSAKKEVSNKVNFPADFVDLVYEQPNNAVVKAYKYTRNTSRFTYFAPCPQTAFAFANDLSGFWGAMLGYKQITKDNYKEVKALLRKQVEGLNIQSIKKMHLYLDISLNLEEYANTKKVKMLITDRDNAYDWQACRMNGADYNQQYGEIEPYAYFYDIKQRYKASGADEKDIVLAEIKNLYTPANLYCKELTPRAERVSTAVTFSYADAHSQTQEDISLSK